MSGLDERRRRILTTHTGSLPRPDALSALIFAKVTKGSGPATLFASAARWQHPDFRSVP